MPKVKDFVPKKRGEIKWSTAKTRLNSFPGGHSTSFSSKQKKRRPGREKGEQKSFDFLNKSYILFTQLTKENLFKGSNSFRNIEGYFKKFRNYFKKFKKNALSFFYT